MLAAVLDPNVLVAAAIAPRGIPVQVLDAAIAGRYSLLVSSHLLLELAEVLGRPKFRHYLSPVPAHGYLRIALDLAWDINETHLPIMKSAIE